MIDQDQTNHAFCPPGLARRQRSMHSHVARLLAVAGACVACSIAPTLAQEEGKKQPEQPQPLKPQPTPAGKPAPTQPVKPGAGNQPGTGASKGGTTATPPHAPPNPAGVNAPAQPENIELPPPTPDPDHWIINATGEISISHLIRLVQRDLGIQILFADAGVQDQKVVLTAPLKIRKEQMLDFLTRLLDSKGYTLFKDDFGIYTVTPTTGGTPAGAGIATPDPYSATQIIPTRGIKPSSINNYVTALGSGGAGGQIIAMDEFGVIIVTDTSARTKLIRDFIDQLASLRDAVKIIPLDVTYVSAATARERILSLVGESSAANSPGGPFQTPGGVANKPGASPIPGSITGGAGSTTSNLAAQLTVSPFSNALFFKGREEEVSFVRDLLGLVDVPNRMEGKFYPIGLRAAEVISAMGTREGLGDVSIQEVSEDSSASPLGGAGSRANLGQAGLQQPGLIGGQQQQTALAGSGFVIFPEPGGFMYYGTREQQVRVNELIEKNAMLTVGEQIVYKFYKLKHTKALDIADIITSLVNNQMPAGNTGGIIGNDLSRGSSRRGSRAGRSGDVNQPASQAGRTTQPGASGAGIGGLEAGDDTFVMADEKQNQIIVKTLHKLQPEFAKLIQKLDARRPQVYISAQIVAVTGSENFRLAFEHQWLAGQFALTTNNGLSSFEDGGTIQDRKTVATDLPGLTAAIIRSDTVPLIITALQNNSDTRVLATPQLLVDDNEPATITSENVVPTQQTIDTDTGTTRTSVGESARAGTTLDVLPQISENGVKLSIGIELSSFTGSPASPELPPPSQENTIESEVTVPRDSTIVIGGLTLESIGKTVIKVPLIGDIPILGHLFRDQSKTTQKTTLYVFITPRIMTDPNSMDIRLLSQGPAREAGIKSEFMLPAPELMTSKIDMPKAPMLTPATAEPAAPIPPTPSVPPPVPIEAEIEHKKP